MLESIERTGRALALFTAERPEWGVSEAAAAHVALESRRTTGSTVLVP